jgi:GntR family transcriptional regulator
MTASDHALAQGRAADGVPLYLRVAISLRSRIHRGEWSVGQQLPSFEDLAEGYGVSLNTVRRAVQMIASESLVESCRGRGTTVLANRGAQAYEQLGANLADPLATQPDLSIRILESGDAATLSDALRAGGTPAEAYHRTLKVHTLHDTPFALLEIYVDRAVYRRFPRGAERRHKLSVLMRRYGRVALVSSRQLLTIGHADPRTAAALDCPIASPVVRLRRWRVDAGGRIAYACDVLYRGDMFVWDVTEPIVDSESPTHDVIPNARMDRVAARRGGPRGGH